MSVIFRLIANTIAVMAAAYIVPGITVHDFWTALVVAIVLGILNIFIKPLVVLFTLPITILTLGLFMLVINTGLVLLTSRIVPGFAVDSFFSGLLFSLIFSLIASFLSTVDQD